jgi:hypothetical protein
VVRTGNGFAETPDLLTQANVQRLRRYRDLELRIDRSVGIAAFRNLLPRGKSDEQLLVRFGEASPDELVAFESGLQTPLPFPTEWRAREPQMLQSRECVGFLEIHRRKRIAGAGPLQQDRLGGVTGRSIHRAH